MEVGGQGEHAAGVEGQPGIAGDVGFLSHRHLGGCVTLRATTPGLEFSSVGI